MLFMIRARPEVETRIPGVMPPLVRVLTVHSESVQLSVRSQGTVAPRTANPGSGSKSSLIPR